MAVIKANGIAIQYRIDGPENAPWLTFSNSHATNLSLWDDQVAEFGTDYRILRYDQRGHGATEATPPPYMFDLLVADIVALWDALRVDQSHFVGLSMGGTTGVGVALDHPGRLLSLTGADCRCDAQPAFQAAWEPRIELARDEGTGALAGPTTERWFTDGFKATNPDTIEWIKDMIRTTSLDGYIGCAVALQNIGYLPRMGEIDVPALFISGAQDSAATPELMSELQAMVTGAWLVTVNPAGHISNVESPDQFNLALGTFLGSL